MSEAEAVPDSRSGEAGASAERRLEFLLSLGDRLLATTDPDGVMEATAQALGPRLAIARVGYAEVDANQTSFVIRHDWTDGTAPRPQGRRRLAEFGPRLVDVLASGELAAVADVACDPLTRDVADAFTALSCRAVLAAPLLRRGALAGVLFAQHTEPRPWSAADIQLMRDTAGRAFDALERARAEARLGAERRSVEAANRRLSAETDFLHRLFEQAPSFMAVLQGPDHVFTFANPAYLALVGRKVVGLPLDDALPEVETQGFRALLDEVYRTGRPYIGTGAAVLLTSPEGGMRERVLNFVYQPIHDSQGQVSGIFVEGSDVTETAAMAETLAIAQRAGGVGAFEWFPETGKLVVSDEYRRIWGLPADGEITADTLMTLVDPRDLGATALARLEHSNPLEYAEYRIRRPDTGEIRWLARRGEVVKGDGRTPPRYIGVSFDITERKRAETALRELNETLERRVDDALAQREAVEEALRQSQKMEAIGQLTGGIAHDFNNLLTGVIGAIDLVRRRIEDGRTDGLDRFMDAAMTSAQRAASLTQRLLAFARRQTLDPRPLDANRLVLSMVDLLARTLGEQIHLETRLEPGVWPALSDAAQLESVVLNLAINARDAMPDGGVLTIATSNAVVDRQAAEESGLEPGDYLALSVSDTGVGMSPSVQARAFEPFFTTKPIGQGTGLGLSMIYGFAKQSGGHVSIRSRPGEGATVTVLLPRHHGGVEEEESQAARAAPRGAGETVLVVEDDSQVRLLVLEVLAELGYEALEASDAEAALPLLRSERPIELLISDVGLPGINGRQLAEMARQLRPALKVLFVTGYAQNVAVRAGFLGEDMDMIAKPFDLDRLAGKIREMLGSG